MNTSRILWAIGALAATLPTWAGEGTMDLTTRKILLRREYAEYRKNLSHVDSIPITINAHMLWLGPPKTYSFRLDQPHGSTAADQAYWKKTWNDFKGATTDAMGLWTNAPHSYIRMHHSVEPAVTGQERDGKNVVTLMGGRFGSDGTSGETGYYLELYQEDPYIWDADVGITYGRSKVETTLTLVHELGHLLGFNHSMARSAANMAYGDDTETLNQLQRGKLMPEDIALAAEMYPDHKNRIWRTHGTVSGNAVWRKANGYYNLYGAYVSLKDSQGRVIRHGVSGYKFYKSQGASFELQGVPEGSYTMIIAPYNLREFKTPLYNVQLHELNWKVGGRRDRPTKFFHAEAEFAKGFPQAIVREVRVRRGVETFLGNVVAGDWELPPQQSFSPASISRSPQVEYIPPQFTYYQYGLGFWSIPQRRWVHFDFNFYYSCFYSGGQTRDYSRSVPLGEYYVVWVGIRWNPRTKGVAFDWLSIAYRNYVDSLSWKRLSMGQIDYYGCVLILQRKNQEGRWINVLNCHPDVQGEAIDMKLAPGLHRYIVLSRKDGTPYWVIDKIRHAHFRVE